MNQEKLEKILKNFNQPKFRLGQIKKAIYQDGVSDFSQISNIPKDLRDFLKKEIRILSFEVGKIAISREDGSVKGIFSLKDKNTLESVLMSNSKGAFSICVSSQVGCPLGCQFCATGQGGFKRNLTAEEITDQVLFWKQWVKKLQNPKISNVVFMGMGEPFLNWEAVKKSIEDLINPKIFAFGSRAISVSTSGIPEGISKLAKDLPQINLALSLHFTDNKKRSQYMPINKNNDLESLKDALWDYFKKTKRKVFLEYIMLSGINDSQRDVEKLAEYVRSIGNIRLLHINLIRYNFSPGMEFRPSRKNLVLKFRDYLLKNKINCTIRKSLGGDISAACGQLVWERCKKTRKNI